MPSAPAARHWRVKWASDWAMTSSAWPSAVRGFVKQPRHGGVLRIHGRIVDRRWAVDAALRHGHLPQRGPRVEDRGRHADMPRRVPDQGPDQVQLLPKGILNAIEDREAVQVTNVGHHAVGQGMARIAVVVHEFEEIEVVYFDVAQVGLDGFWPRGSLRWEVVPKRQRRPVRLPARQHGGKAFDLVHGIFGRKGEGLLVLTFILSGGPDLERATDPSV